MKKPYLKVSDVAEMLSVTERTVYRMIKDKKIESVKFGGSRRISEKALDRYINSETNKR